MAKIDLILLSSGIGARSKLEYPKQFLKLGNKKMICHIIDLFTELDFINNIIVTTIPEKMQMFSFLKYEYNNIILVNGGDTRQASVNNALNVCCTNRIIIHESVRPFITKQHIIDLVSIKNSCVVPKINIYPTLYYNHSCDEKRGYLDRNVIYNIQLPQVFDCEILKCGHRLASDHNKKYTDDSSLLYYELMIKPNFVDGLEENIKITTDLDVKIVRALFNEYYNNRR